jgi:hypothetical protein
LEKQVLGLIKQSYIGGFIPLSLQTTAISLKKGENLLWESSAAKMKQQSSGGMLYWNSDESGMLIVTSQRIIFRPEHANLWTRNLSKVVGVEQQPVGSLQVVVIYVDGLQRPVGFYVGDVQATMTFESRTFQFSLDGSDLREILRGRV